MATYFGVLDTKDTVKLLWLCVSSLALPLQLKYPCLHSSDATITSPRSLDFTARIAHILHPYSYISYTLQNAFS